MNDTSREAGMTLFGFARAVVPPEIEYKDYYNEQKADQEINTQGFTIRTEQVGESKPFEPPEGLNSVLMPSEDQASIRSHLVFDPRRAKVEKLEIGLDSLSKARFASLKTEGFREVSFVGSLAILVKTLPFKPIPKK